MSNGELEVLEAEYAKIKAIPTERERDDAFWKWRERYARMTSLQERKKSESENQDGRGRGILGSKKEKS